MAFHYEGSPMSGFVDIHCHLLPGIDDGSKSLDESLAMASIAVADGIETIIVTPHQLGAFLHNDGAAVRAKTAQLQQHFNAHQIPLRVLPGADVRIEEGMIEKLQRGEVVTLADRGKHLLLELPHELYFPLEPVLQAIQRLGICGILSHPERNLGLLKQPQLLAPLVEHGCLMQVTAGSLLGTFGKPSQDLAEWMLREGLVHFLATDAHGSKSRRPLLARAFERATELVGSDEALNLCQRNPAAIVAGRDVPNAQPRGTRKTGSHWLFKGWRKVA
jgi:protein-tyrosine phosphatase